MNPVPALLFASIVALSSTLAGAEPAPSRLPKPLLPVIGKVDQLGVKKQDKGFSDAEVDALAANYIGLELWSSRLGSPQLAALKAKNPDFLILPYLNSSNAPGGWMEVLEKDRFNTISLYLEATLSNEIGAGDTTLKMKPADASHGLRLKASTVAGTQSRSAKAFVSFVRVDDELMRIESVDAGGGAVTVSRGFDGTQADSHRAGSRVFAPVYVGSTGEWVGVPDHSSGAVRYAMRIESEQVAQLLASHIIKFMSKGASGAWLDICSPSFYNLANAFGEQVTPWDFATNAPYDRRSRKDAQDRKLNRMQTLVHEANGAWPELTANNLAGGDYFDAGGGGMDFLRPTNNKPRPIRAVILEGAFSYHVKNQYSKLPVWKVNLSTLMHATQNGLSVWPWLKSYPDSLRPQTPQEEEMALYDYASVLLGWEFGGGSAIVTEALTAEGGGGRSIYLPRFWFYDLGKPTERAPFDDIEKLRVRGHVSYARHWSNGIVYVNPTDRADGTIDIESGYADPESGEAVHQLQLGPNQGRILLRAQAP